MKYNIKFFGKFNKIPISLIVLISIICTIGFITLYSASKGNYTPYVSKQIINFIIFFLIAIIIAIIDIKFIYNFSYIFYVIILILLISVDIFGVVIMGAKRWIDLKLFKIQPSEMIKLAIVVMLARYFHNIPTDKVNNILYLFKALILVLIPTMLIIKQPDLGTGVITMLVAIIMFFAIGVSIWYFIVLGSTLLCSLPVIWHYMHEYQRKRVLMFLDPEKDTLGAGYNIIQSKIAIGSGKITGKGLMSGTQNHLNFLPEHQTDFIFASFAEEFGLLGGLLLLILYSLVIVISLIIAQNSKSTFGKMLVIGIVSIFFSHIFINISMVMGLLPVVGVPLTFISYGGTMMATMLIGFGIIMNVQVHSNKKI